MTSRFRYRFGSVQYMRYVSWDFGPYHRAYGQKHTMCGSTVPPSAVRLNFAIPENRCKQCEEKFTHVRLSYERTFHPDGD